MDLKKIELIQEMVDLGFDLYGSRYFHNKDPLLIHIFEDTDWDFACPEEDKYLSFLRQFGFRKSRSRYGNDDNTLAVYKHPGFNIDVSIKKDMNIHKDIFHNMSPEFYYRHLWKHSDYKRNTRESITDIINELVRVLKLHKDCI